MFPRPSHPDEIFRHARRILRPENPATIRARRSFAKGCSLHSASGAFQFVVDWLATNALRRVYRTWPLGHECSDAIVHRCYSLLFGAVRAAIKDAVRFDAVPDDLAAAMIADRSEGVDGALKAVEEVRFT